jgi:UDP-N-acetylmuramate dehydrogenase
MPSTVIPAKAGIPLDSGASVQRDPRLRRDDIKKILPEIRGQYRFDAPLAKTTWFQVGGPADVLFKPADTDDLAHFLKNKLADLPVTVLGVGSNLIIRDGGIEGAVIKLGRGFTQAELQGGEIEAGAALLDVHLARYAADQGRAGLEFFAGIPGTVGGALAMNAGAYGAETKDVLLRAEGVLPSGEIITIHGAQLNYSYRHYGGPEGLIFTRAWFKTTEAAPAAIHARIGEIQKARGETQPIREKTGGSTFKNPQGHKAWQLVDQAGCRGLKVGDAQVSPLHANFMINTGAAKAADLEALGEEVRARVAKQSGISLEWEIKRIGRS